MKSRILTLLAFLLLSTALFAQKGVIMDGKINNDIKWVFDGKTLTIGKVDPDKYQFVSMPDYDLKQNLAPWIKRKLPIKKVKIDEQIERIGSCSFANCTELTDVEFVSSSLTEIGWGAFLNCKNLRNFSIPNYLQKIETIAFANCASLTSVKIPFGCRVDDQAFLSCTSISLIEIAPTAQIGHYVFATEVKDSDGNVSHKFYNNEIRRLANNINVANCKEFGLAPEAVSKLLDRNSQALTQSDRVISDVDTLIPPAQYVRNDTYALVIGNQKYRFASDVPFANHDAYMFAEYLKINLGVPSQNIHVCEDATKYIMTEEEMDWLQTIPDRNGKKLIVYYAGHGVPDTKNGNRAYILPTDVYGTKPSRGIALDDFYANLGELGFNHVSVFLDACFSGVNRDMASVNKELGERAVEVDAEDGKIGTNMIVFSAAQGNETAQAYTEQGHGLFTYYLLKELHDATDYVTYGRLSRALQRNVSTKALEMKLHKKQTPSTVASDSLDEDWVNWIF